MDFVNGFLSGLIGWIAPLSGLAISFLAWRRFKAPGTLLAVTAFSLMLIPPVADLIVRQMLQREDGLDLRDVSVALNITAIIGSLGGILLVLSLRRLITAAAASESPEPGVDVSQ